MPSAAPSSGCQVESVSRVTASVVDQMNSAVSRPSRPTASTATITRPHQLVSAATSIWVRRSPARPRAARAIQKIIQVTRPTARIDRIPPIASWASKVRLRGP